MRFTYLYIFLFITAVLPAAAQNNTSPYSIIGIGDIESSTYDKSTGMANAGTSLSSERFLYLQNPASVSRLADHFFTMDVSGRYKGVSYYGNSIGTSTTSTSADFQVKKLSMAIKIKPYWGISFGFMPYSNSSYSFFAPKSIQGTNVFSQTYYQGTGGLNQYYLTNSFRLNKHFSAGIQASYLAGSFTQTEALDSNSLGSSLNTTRNIYMAKLYAKAGILYNAQLSKKWKIALGATASNKTTLNADYYLTVNSNGSTIVGDKTIKNSYFTLPAMYGTGISLIYNNYLTFSGDYQYQNWGSLNYSGLGYSLVNSNRISAGFQYAKNVGYLDNFFERSNLQMGFYYGNSYLNINNYQLKDYGVTVGAGFSNKSGQLGCQFNMSVGRRGTTQNNLIREDYITFGLMLTYREIWYTKLRKFF